MTEETIKHYHENAEYFQSQYDSLAPDDVHSDWLHLLQVLEPGEALDVGAATGRDALWLVDQGWRVSAVEPARGLREAGQEKTGHKVRWFDSRLPQLEGVSPGYDLILLSAVWMHVAPSMRLEALTRLSDLLNANGRLIISLRSGPSDPQRPMYPVTVGELRELSETVRLRLEEITSDENLDRLGRKEVSWKTVCLSHNRGAS